MVRKERGIRALRGEAWAVYSRHVELHEQFSQISLRYILNIKWLNHVSNVNALENAKLTRIEAILIK